MIVLHTSFYYNCTLICLETIIFQFANWHAILCNKQFHIINSNAGREESAQIKTAATRN
jgi:hypothetical protein